MFQKKEWLCLNCQTQRALSGSLGDIPTPVPQHVGSPRSPAAANQQPPQQQGPNQVPGPRPTGPQLQQQIAPGHQVSGPLSPAIQPGPSSQTKGPSQPSPQSKSSSQPKPSSQPPSQTKGPAQPSAQSKAPGQVKGQPAAQVKGPGQARGPAKAPSHSSGAKASPTSGKAAPNHAKSSPAPSKTTPVQSKPTGNNQSRKQPQGQEKTTKTTSKPLKEDVKLSPKKTVTEIVTSPKDTKIDEDAQMSRHQEVSYLQPLRLQKC